MVLPAQLWLYNGAGFDSHEKCACSGDKRIGSDACVVGDDCGICQEFTDSQGSMLATPQYQIPRDKKSGLLVSPSKVTVDTVQQDPSDPVRTFLLYLIMLVQTSSPDRILIC